jgi:hypothetical protein
LEVVSIASGILSIFVWPVAYISLPIAAIGVASGVFAQRRRKSVMATAGILLAAAGLALTILDLKIGLLDLILKTYFQT